MLIEPDDERAERMRKLMALACDEKAPTQAREAALSVWESLAAENLKRPETDDEKPNAD